MNTQDQQWAVRLLERHTTGARWIKVLKVGEIRFTVGIRVADKCRTDKEVRDREAFLASLHPDIWEARLMRSDRDGETYHVQFTKPRQLNFLDGAK